MDCLLKNRKDSKEKKPKDITCHYCKGKNYYARDCTKKKRNEAAKQKANLANQTKPSSEVALKST